MAIMWRDTQNGAIEKVYRPGLLASVVKNIPSGKYIAVIFTGPEFKGVADYQGGFNLQSTAMYWADDKARGK